MKASVQKKDDTMEEVWKDAKWVYFLFIYIFIFYTYVIKISPKSKKKAIYCRTFTIELYTLI